MNNTVVFRLDNDVSLTGTGTFSLAGVNARVSDDTNSFVRLLTNASGHTINGYGLLGNDGIAITNAGVIDANVSGATLNLDVAGANGVNSGTLRASAGTLSLAAGSFNNAGGTIAATGTGAVSFQAGFNLTGGTIAAATGTGTYTVAGNAVGFTSLTNNAAIGIAPDALLAVTTALTNNGTVTVGTGVNNSVAFRIDSDVTLNGTGKVTLNGTGARLTADTNSFVFRLTNAATQTVDGYGALGSDGIAITNNGLIDADVANRTLTVDVAGTGGVNTGTLRASAGTLALAAGTFDNTGGTIAATGTGAVAFQNGLVVRNGTIAAATGTGTYAVSSGTVSLVSVTNNAAIAVTPDTTLAVTTALTNNGTVTLGTGVNNSVGFRLDSDVALNGTGTLTLNGINARVSDDTNSFNYRLTIAAAQTVNGFGLLGNDAITFTNNGLIDANVAGSTLTVDSAGGETSINNATIRASTGTLALLAGTYGNANGTIQAQAAGTVSLQNGANVTGGTISGAGTVGVTSGTVSLTSVTNAAAIGVASDTTLAITTALTNNGTITLGTGVNNSVGFRIDSDVSLGGTGKLTLNNTNARVSDDTNSFVYRLTIGSGQTVDGFGRLGDDAIAITNNGLVDADVSGTTLSFDVAGTTGANAGTIRASAGTLAFIAGTLDNAGGTIASTGAGAVSFQNGFELQNGTVAAATGTGTYAVATGAVGFTNVTNNAAIGVAPDTTLQVTSGLTNNGAITLGTGVNNAVGLILRNNVTVGGTGTVTLKGLNARVSDDTNSFVYVLTNGVGHTFNGYGGLGVDAINLVNNGTFAADTSSQTLTVDPAQTAANNGTFRATGGGTLRLAAGTFDNTGTIEALDASTVTYDGGATLNETTTSRLTNSTAAVTFATYRVVDGGGGATLDLPGAAGGIVTIGNADELGGRVIVDVAGPNSVIKFGGIFLGASLQAVDVGGQLVVRGGRTFTTNGPLTVNGRVGVGQSSVLAATGAIDASATTSFVTGGGRYNATTTTVGGTLSPGNNLVPGEGQVQTLTFGGNLVMLATAGTGFDLGAIGAPQDLINVTANLTIDGTFNIFDAGGLQAGSYLLIGYGGSLTNNVVNVALFTSNPNLSAQIDLTTPNQVRLNVTATPEPTTLAIASLGSIVLAARRRRTRRA